MTHAQLKWFYMPAWRRCAHANDWTMSRGRLVADLAAQREESLQWKEPYGPTLRQVLDLAAQLAAKIHRAIIADDLRHACNVVATGRESSKNLTNPQVNRVVSLFNLLRDPEDLDAIMAWLHPENAERASFISFLRKQASEEALCAISRNAYDTIFWEDLELSKLRWMCTEVKSRKRKLDVANAPF